MSLRSILSPKLTTTITLFSRGLAVKQLRAWYFIPAPMRSHTRTHLHACAGCYFYFYINKSGERERERWRGGKERGKEGEKRAFRFGLFSL